ncbi:MAG: hypothetical protein ACKUBY_04580 [Candidatus Moraniibacteriota bacterium]|jgi:hypothetical protein
MSKKTLEQQVYEVIGDDVDVPGTIQKQLSFCSEKIKYAKTADDVDMIMQKYSLLNTKFEKNGLYERAFDNIIDNFKKELG